MATKRWKFRKDSQCRGWGVWIQFQGFFFEGEEHIAIVRRNGTTWEVRGETGRYKTRGEAAEAAIRKHFGLS